MFTPDKLMLCASFDDGSVYFWTVDTLTLVWKITLAELTNPDIAISVDLMVNLYIPRQSYFDISQSGELFAYGGLYYF
jgi:hypothetical protein